MKKVEERDHIDGWLEKAWLQDIPNLDFAVEGIVDRMSGLTRRFKRSLNDVLAEHGLTFEEWDVLGALRRAGPPFRRSAGELAKLSELSSGAMTNRLDRLEKAGFVKRLPDPDDRRGVLIELTKAGGDRVARVDGRRGRARGADRGGSDEDGEGAAERAAPPADARVRAARRQRVEEAVVPFPA